MPSDHKYYKVAMTTDKATRDMSQTAHAQKSPPSPPSSTSTDYKSGTNWVHGGGIEANPYLFILIIVSPFLSLLLAYVTSAALTDADLPWRATHPLTEMAPACLADVGGCLASTLAAGASVVPTVDAGRLVLAFMAVALALERSLPGKVECGPETGKLTRTAVLLLDAWWA